MGDQEILKITIVGGGIAGLATAIALRGKGRQITVLEQSRMNKEVGALISLQPNASKIATKFGLDAFLECKKPMTDQAFRIFDGEGKHQATIPLITKQYGAQRMLYHRVDLHDALKSAATSDDLSGPPARILTSSKVVSCDCERASVTLESGEELHGDVLIGADGIRSQLRKFVVGGGHDPKQTGTSCYRVLLPTSQLKDIEVVSSILKVNEAVTTMVLGKDRRVIMGPARGGEIFGLVILVPDEVTSADVASNSWTTSASREKLLENVSTLPSWIQEICRRAPDDIALWQLRDIDPLSTWVKGRTVLIGDAAHAMLPTQGQGASQTFEDAEALQAVLQDLQAGASADEIRTKLEEVFDIRYERASLIQKYSRQQGLKGGPGGIDTVKLNPAQFMDYNSLYEGARAWQAAQREKQLETALQKLRIKEDGQETQHGIQSPITPSVPTVAPVS